MPHPIKLLDGAIAAIEQGKPSENPVVMVHGYLDNAASFTPLLPYLEHLNCVAIDLPGHGHSAHRSYDAHYHLVDYVYDLHQIIQAHSWENITLVGHSLGGIICMMYSAIFPETVKHLVCIESMGPLTEPEFSSVQQLRASMLSREKAKGEIKQPISLQGLVEARMRVSDLSADNARLIMQRNIIESHDAIKWRTDKRLRTASTLRLTPNQAMNILESIAIPVNIVLGDTGFSKVKRLYKHRQGLFKQLNVIELPGGHHVHMEQPERVSQFVNDILTKS